MLIELSHGTIERSRGQAISGLQRKDRMSAQFKEVIMDADTVHTQHFGPDLRHAMLDLIAGGLSPSGSPVKLQGKRHFADGHCPPISKLPAGCGSPPEQALHTVAEQKHM